MKVQRSKIKWASLATWIDSEGSLYIYEHFPSYRAGIEIAGTDERLMKWLVINFGGNVYHKINDAHYKNSQLLYQWKLYGCKNRERILLGIMPYLILKKEQALLLLEYLRLNGQKVPEKRHELMIKCKTLNSRKQSVTTNTPNSPITGRIIESELLSNKQSAALVITAA